MHIISGDVLKAFLSSYESDLSNSIVERTETVAEANDNVVMYNEHEGLTGEQHLFNTVDILDDSELGVEATLETINAIMEDERYLSLFLGTIDVNEDANELAINGDNAFGYETSEDYIETDADELLPFKNDYISLLVKPFDIEDEKYQVEFAFQDANGTLLELTAEQDIQLEALYDILDNLSTSDSTSTSESEPTSAEEVSAKLESVDNELILDDIDELLEDEGYDTEEDEEDTFDDEDDNEDDEDDDLDLELSDDFFEGLDTSK